MRGEAKDGKAYNSTACQWFDRLGVARLSGENQLVWLWSISLRARARLAGLDSPRTLTGHPLSLYLY